MPVTPSGQGGRAGTRHARRLARRFAVVAALLSLLLYWWHPTLLERIDTRARDVVFQLRQAPPPSPLVAVVAVDEASVKRYGRWPWSRELQARLIERLKSLGAAVIGLDIVYSSPSTPAADQALAKALAAPGAPVIGGYFFRDVQSVAPAPAALAVLRRHRIGAVLASHPGARAAAVPDYPHVEISEVGLARRFAGLGFFNYIPDADGLVRAAPVVLRYHGDYYPSLPLAALAELSGQPAVLNVDDDGVSGLRLGPLALPVDRLGRLELNFYDHKRPVPLLSAASVLDGKIDRKAIAGKLIFVGVTEVGIADVRPTPIDDSFPGVAVHATVASNVIQGRFLSRDRDAVLFDVAMMGLLPLLMVWAISHLRRPWAMAAIYLATLGFVWGAFYYALAAAALVVSLVYPLIGVTLGYLVFQTYHQLVSERQGRFLRQAFSTYVSPALVNRLIRDPDTLSLAGEKRPISVLFSDIRGFTSISEAMSPEQLVALLQHYLGPMTDAVMEENGTLDKYIGDAVMAIFNAPLDVAEHPRHAGRCALRMLERLDDLNRGFREEYGVSLRIGIGIHTGEAIVGNMGSSKRFDYTAMGDTVNLASRLEGRTKAYGVEIVISGDTAAQLGEGFLLRRLDRIRVKGKSRPVEIFQLCRDQRPATRALAERFEAALEHYFAGRFSKALAEFLALAGEYPGDAPSRLYVERCEQHINEPPVGEWDGVFTAQEK